MKHIKEIEQLLETTRNPHEIQRQCGASLSDIRKVMRGNPSELPGWGRPNIQPHILSRRRVGANAWPMPDFQVITEHKRLHDQGRVVMCQGRDGEWIIQYAMPVRGRPLRRAAYFYGG